MDLARLSSITDEIVVASAPSLGRFVADALTERSYKLAWMDNWPELFGDWSREERDSIDLDTTWKIIRHRLLHHTGESTPRGILSSAGSIIHKGRAVGYTNLSSASSITSSSVRPIIAKAAAAAVPRLPNEAPR